MPLVTPDEEMPAQRTGIVFDHIPRLRELVPNGGWPGVIYAQVAVPNLRAANDRTELPAAGLKHVRGTQFYSIRGPRGEISMALTHCGKPIPGAHPEGGERLFFTDASVEEATGLPVGKYPIWLSPVEELPIPAPEPVRSTWVEPPPKPVKRKYVRKKPWGSKEQRAALAKAKSMTYRKPHGQWGAEKEVTHGEVGSGAQDGEENAGIEDRS